MHGTLVKSFPRHVMPSTAPLRDVPPSPAEVSAALGRILASTEFARSRRLTEFLAYVVEGALEDGATARKGYTIGVEALGRPVSFDADRDAGVRVTATRLRVALARYYAGEGLGDPIVIGLPRGSYLPAISRAQRPALPALYRRLHAISRLLAARVRRLLPPVPNPQTAPARWTRRATKRTD
jgi:hypothetical protein